MLVGRELTESKNFKKSSVKNKFSKGTKAMSSRGIKQ
jgi:hypothetical protein